MKINKEINDFKREPINPRSGYVEKKKSLVNIF